MKAQTPFKFRYVLQGCAIGTAFTVLAFVLVGVAENLGGILLFPGMLLADAMHYGGHDLEAYAIIIFGNWISYSAVAFLVTWLVRAGRQTPAPPVGSPPRESGQPAERV